MYQPVGSVGLGMRRESISPLIVSIRMTEGCGDGSRIATGLGRPGSEDLG